MSQSSVSDCDDVLSSKSPPSTNINHEIEMEKLKAENHVINELLVREKIEKFKI